MKTFFRNNGLSLVLALMFVIFWACQAVAGWHVHNEEQLVFDRPQIGFVAYLGSGHFWQATAENWESEFLQMGFYVVLTCFLFQKGSAESKDPDNPDEGDSPESCRRAGFLYRNSLSLAFLGLFLLSFCLHAFGGLIEENDERSLRHQPPESMSEFLTGAQFWFQSFQNWQSEFLAVLSIVTLTIFLRQHGSPESKKLDAAHSETGK
jgi:hypothetical protein